MSNLTPYFLDGLPTPQPTPCTGLRAGKRRVYWAASLGKEDHAGCSDVRIGDVRRWLEGAGFTEVLVSHDAADVADVVGMLRDAFKAGRRSDVFRG